MIGVTYTKVEVVYEYPADEEQPGTEEVTTGPTVDTEGLCGDANPDGVVNLSDVVLVNKSLMIGTKLSDQGRKNADADLNGEMDEVDTLNILKSIIHLVTLPVTTK